MKYKNKGFTLIELMVTMTISTFIMAGIYGLFAVGGVAWRAQSANVEAQNQARLTYYTIARDLRSSQGLVITQTPNANNSDIIDIFNMTLSNPKGDDIEYSWTSLGDNANQLSRVCTSDSVATTRIVAQDISTLVLTEGPSIDEILIEIIVNVALINNSEASGETADYRLVSKIVKR